MFKLFKSTNCAPQEQTPALSQMDLSRLVVDESEVDDHPSHGNKVWVPHDDSGMFKAPFITYSLLKTGKLEEKPHIKELGKKELRLSFFKGYNVENIDDDNSTLLYRVMEKTVEKKYYPYPGEHNGAFSHIIRKGEVKMCFPRMQELTGFASNPARLELLHRLALVCSQVAYRVFIDGKIKSAGCFKKIEGDSEQPAMIKLNRTVLGEWDSISKENMTSIQMLLDWVARETLMTFHTAEKLHPEELFDTKSGLRPVWV